MNEWSKEDLEEMCGDDIIEQLAFLSGCHQHELCNGNPSGWIIPDESLRKFAELIVRECAQIATEQGNTAEHSFTAIRAKWFRLGAIKSATMIKRTFGVEE